MNNQMTIQTNYNSQMGKTLDGTRKIDVQLKTTEGAHYLNLIENKQSIPDKLLYSSCFGGERASFHPKMLLKIILYVYTQKIILEGRLIKW